jgi:hypothetical protein
MDIGLHFLVNPKREKIWIKCVYCTDRATNENLIEKKFLILFQRNCRSQLSLCISQQQLRNRNMYRLPLYKIIRFSINKISFLKEI